MTDNQYYGILKTMWLLAHECDAGEKFLKRLETLLRKQDMEEIREKITE